MKKAFSLMAATLFILWMGASGFAASDGPESAYAVFDTPHDAFRLDVQTLSYGSYCSGKVTSKPRKIKCDNSASSVCAGTFRSYSTVELKAIPDKGCVFSGWYILQDSSTGAYQDMSKYTDKCEGVNPCGLTLGSRADTSKTVPYVTAYFEKAGQKIDLQVTVDDTSADEGFSIKSDPKGINCNKTTAEAESNTCKASFKVGTVVKLTAKGKTGKFLGWQGSNKNCYGSDNECELLMTRDVSELDFVNESPSLSRPNNELVTPAIRTVSAFKE